MSAVEFFIRKGKKTLQSSSTFIKDALHEASPDEILGSALDFLMFILYWQVKFAWICAFSDITAHGWLEVLGFRDWPCINQTDGQLLIVYNGANVAEISSNYHKVMVSFD